MLSRFLAGQADLRGETIDRLAAALGLRLADARARRPAPLEPEPEPPPEHAGPP